MEYGVRGMGDALGTDLAGRGAEQRQQLGRPAAEVLMGLPYRLSDRLSTRPGLESGLVRTRLVLAPDRHPGRLG